MDISRLNQLFKAYPVKNREDEHGDKIAHEKGEEIEFWGEIRKQNVQEYIKGKAPGENTTMVVGIRWQNGEELSTDMVIEHRGKEYDLIDISPDFTGRDYTLITMVKIEERGGWYNV